VDQSDPGFLEDKLGVRSHVSRSAAGTGGEGGKPRRLRNYEFSPAYHFLPAQAWRGRHDGR